MITIEQYAGIWKDSPDWTLERQDNARRLLHKCSLLEAEMIADGVEFPINPKTHSEISGETLGGFRPQSCTVGAPHSSHKEGRAVDRYDPKGDIDTWCLEHQDRLRHYGLYIEHPGATIGWSHWTDRAPASGKTVFWP